MSEKRTEKAAALTAADLAGWRDVERQAASLDGQQALPGFEAVERDRQRQQLPSWQRKAEAAGQLHLF